MNTIPGYTPIRAARSALPLLALAGLLLAPGIAAAADGAKSFVDNFDTIDKARWFVSDGWNNGPHQNCTWSKKLLKADNGVLTLSFEKGKLGNATIPARRSRPSSASPTGLMRRA